jgi:SAM-dependent methyltransferase
MAGAPSLADLWEQNAVAWAAFAGSGDEVGEYHALQFLELLPQPGRATLGLGCGEGRLGRALVRHGHRVTGVDVSPTLAKLAQEAGGYDAVIGASAASLPFSDGSFDLVLAFMSLQDMDDMPAAVLEAARVLVPGGCFAVAITHPICTAGDFLGDPNEDGFALNRPYFTPSRYTWNTETAAGDQVKLHGEHRPLEAYSRAIEQAGLRIEAVREPIAPPSFLAEHPTSAYLGRVPFFMHLRTRRP